MTDTEAEDAAELTVAIMRQWYFYNEQLAELAKNMRTFIKNNKDIANMMSLSFMFCTTSVDLSNIEYPEVTTDVAALYASDETLKIMLDTIGAVSEGDIYDEE